MVEYRCVNCDILFDWQPTVVRGRLFCCTGCAQGGPCSCDYENLPRDPVVREPPDNVAPTAANPARSSIRHETIFPVHGPAEG